MTKRITSLAKAKEKERILDEYFEKIGITTMAKEINITYRHDADNYEILRKLITAFKRKIKKHFNSLSSLEKKTDYPSKFMLKHTKYQISLKEVNESNEKNPGFHSYIQKMLAHCQPTSLRKTKKTEELKVAEITLTNGKGTITGYGLLNSEITQNYHNTRRKFGWSERDFEMLWDIPSILGEVAAAQAIESYAHKNPEKVSYLTIEELTKYNPESDTIIFFVPHEERLRKDFIRIINETIFGKPFLPSDVPKKFGEYTFSKKEFSEIDKTMMYGWMYYDDIKRPIKNHEGLVRLAKEFVDELGLAKKKAEEETRSRSQYAAAFQTKKYINKTHFEKMVNNEFLKFYGYVELDNEVDLEKFSKLESEFKELTKTIPFIKRKDYSFRVKKLGKHKAEGIFFPHQKTIIFDINHPNAFMHEWFHQLDYLLAEGHRVDYYSETTQFRNIIKLYRRKVEKKILLLDENDEWAKRWHSNSKYNKEYYFQPTEIFARCGEMYLIAQNISTSLAKTKEEILNSPVYLIDDVDFINKITATFDVILREKVKEISENTSAKKINNNSATIQKNNRKTESMESEQLLFDI